MKKSGADDISNLFKQFGGQADRYQEIAQANEARLSRERWPLLNAIGSERAPSPPPVPAASAPPPPVSAEPVRETPRPFLSPSRPDDSRRVFGGPQASSAAGGRFVAPDPSPNKHPAVGGMRPETRREPSLTPPPAPSANPLRDRYVTPNPAPQPTEAPTTTQQHAPASSSPSLTQLFSKLEAAAEAPEPAASTSSLFKRLSQT